MWVEINFTLSAYDEIKMCKSRLRAVDPEELEDETEKQSKLNISKYEVLSLKHFIGLFYIFRTNLTPLSSEPFETKIFFENMFFNYKKKK